MPRRIRWATTTIGVIVPTSRFLGKPCSVTARKKFFELTLSKSPIAAEAVRRIDDLFEIERTVNGKTPVERVAVREERAKPLDRLSPSNDPAKAINYILSRWVPFIRSLDDGRICLSNNAAERALRGVAVGRKNWTFVGSDAGAHRAAAVYTLIETCKLNDVDPQAWLADVLARRPDHAASRITELLPWNWKAARLATAA